MDVAKGVYSAGRSRVLEWGTQSKLDEKELLEGLASAKARFEYAR